MSFISSTGVPFNISTPVNLMTFPFISFILIVGEGIKRKVQAYILMIKNRQMMIR